MNDYILELTLSHYNKSISRFIDEDTYVMINREFELLPENFVKIELPKVGYIGIMIENHMTGDFWYIHREKIIRKLNNISELKFDETRKIENLLLNMFDKKEIPDSFYILENKKLKFDYSHKCSER